MEKDDSEYKMTEQEVYNCGCSNKPGRYLDYFINHVRFASGKKRIMIEVDSGNEFCTIQWLIDQVEKEKAERTGRVLREETPEERKELEEYERENEEKNALVLQRYREKFDMESWNFETKREIFQRSHPEQASDALINVFSGQCIRLAYGEGLLDFIYADFLSPLKEAVASADFFDWLIEAERKEWNITPQAHAPEKIYSADQVRVNDFFSYLNTFWAVKDIAYASLYSAICPPVFAEATASSDSLEWYGRYLLRLQKEYRELIAFCYDENLYPEVLGKLYPSERFALFRVSRGLPTRLSRKETVRFSPLSMDKPEMPFGMPVKDLVARLRQPVEVTPAHEELAKALGMEAVDVAKRIQMPAFISVQYQFGAIAEILELEFTKMLEEDIRFRKCKRCGKYFIMKGNYDTNYCDRVAEGATKNCQELAAQENYKAKIADNKAIPLYNKYYKRYAARVKTGQISEEVFKRWKYQAVTRRDECEGGQITIEEYTQWLEASFPNRKPKK